MGSAMAARRTFAIEVKRRANPVAVTRRLRNVFRGWRASHRRGGKAVQCLSGDRLSGNSRLNVCFRLRLDSRLRFWLRLGFNHRLRFHGWLHLSFWLRFRDRLSGFHLFNHFGWCFSRLCDLRDVLSNRHVFRGDQLRLLVNRRLNRFRMRSVYCGRLRLAHGGLRLDDGRLNGCRFNNCRFNNCRFNYSRFNYSRFSANRCRNRLCYWLNDRLLDSFRCGFNGGLILYRLNVLRDRVADPHFT